MGHPERGGKQGMMGPPAMRGEKELKVHWVFQE